MTRADPARPVVFLAWTARSGRAQDVSAALGAVPLLVFPRFAARLPHPASTALRYAASLLLTAAALLRLRPATVVATNPPVFPALLALAWARASGGRFVMDSHPSAFGAKGKRVLARLQPLHRWLGRRAAAVLVTTEDRAREVAGWGGRGIVVHEAPVSFPPPRRPAQPCVLFIGVYAADEPVAAVVEAARQLPHVGFALTGDPALAAPGLLDDLPDNVSCLGYLGSDAYRDAVVSSSVVLTLTTEPSSVMRSAYEAVYARIPLVTTSTPALRATFPYAVFCDDSAASVAGAVQTALDRLDELVAVADEAAAVQGRRWDEQLAELRSACGVA